MSDFPMIFPECPICKCKETVANTAFREEIKNGNKAIPILTTHCLDQEVRLLQDPRTAKFSAPAIILMWDVCAGCGIRRLIRAEKQNMPVNVEPAPARQSTQYRRGN